MTAYLDASVLLPLMVGETASSAVDAFLRDTPEELPISDFAGAEVAPAISRLVRTSPTMAASHARLADVFVRRFDLMLRAPDALHAAICRRVDGTLVTLDRRIAHAARALGLRVQIPQF